MADETAVVADDDESSEDTVEGVTVATIVSGPLVHAMGGLLADVEELDLPDMLPDLHGERRLRYRLR